MARQDQFDFEQTSENGGEITFRCMSLSVTSDSDEFSESELEWINEIVGCLNAHYLADLNSGDACECGFKDVVCAECGEPRSL